MKNFFLVLSLLVVVESCKKGTDLVATGQVIEYKISPSSVSSARVKFTSERGASPPANMFRPFRAC
jgi:hypothetical protein